METDFLTEILAALDPAACSYQEKNQTKFTHTFHDALFRL